jgi:hypothetical protein
MAASAHELVKQWDSECRTCEARANEGTKRHHEPTGCIYTTKITETCFPQMQSLLCTSAQKCEGKIRWSDLTAAASTRRPPRSKTELHRHPSRGASLPRRRLLSRRNKAAAPHGRSVARVEAVKWELGILFFFELDSESARRGAIDSEFFFPFTIESNRF